jgi:hypothetical protein
MLTTIEHRGWLLTDESHIDKARFEVFEILSMQTFAHFKGNQYKLGSFGRILGNITGRFSTMVVDGENAVTLANCQTILIG